MKRKQARENFSDVASGKRRKASVEWDEAKARLRRVDEDLDISTSLDNQLISARKKRAANEQQMAEREGDLNDT